MTQTGTQGLDKRCWRYISLILIVSQLAACAVSPKYDHCLQEAPSALALKGRLLMTSQAEDSPAAENSEGLQWHFIADKPVCFDPGVIDDSESHVSVTQFKLDQFQLSESFIYLLETGILENYFHLVSRLLLPEHGRTGSELTLVPSSMLSSMSDVYVYLDKTPTSELTHSHEDEGLWMLGSMVGYIVEPASGGEPYEEDTNQAPDDNPVFPWPPPRASTTDKLPQRFFYSDVRLGDVEEKLNEALDEGGYYEKSYYPVPGGFAIVTRLEQIDAAGNPKPEQARWSLSDDLGDDFSLMKYLRKLFTADPGHFRVIVLIVTSKSIELSDQEASREETLRWLDAGWKNNLPADLAERPFTDEHGCIALVYEFEVMKASAPRLVTPSHLPGRHHLKTTQLWETLEKTR